MRVFAKRLAGVREAEASRGKTFKDLNDARSYWPYELRSRCPREGRILGHWHVADYRDLLALEDPWLNIRLKLKGQ
jgi:hypothetical protein